MNREKSPWNKFPTFFSSLAFAITSNYFFLAIRSIKTADNTRFVFTASHFLIIFTQLLIYYFVTSFTESLRWSFERLNSRLQHSTRICFHGHTYSRHFCCNCARFEVSIQTKSRYFSPFRFSKSIFLHGLVVWTYRGHRLQTFRRAERTKPNR